MEKITAESLFELHFISAPVLSPDAEKVVYLVSDTDVKKNDYKTCIHLSSLKSLAYRQLTFDGKAGSPIFDDNDTLIFASSRGKDDEPAKYREKTVFYRLSLSGGEAHRAFSIDKTVERIEKIHLSDPSISNSYLLLVRENLNALPEDASEEALKDDADYHVITELPLWANGDSFVSGIRHALYLYNEGNAKLTKISDDLTDVATFHYLNGQILYTGVTYSDMRPLYGNAYLYNITTMEKQVLLPENTYRIDDGFLTPSGVILVMSDMKPWGLSQMPKFYRLPLPEGNLQLVADPQIAYGNVILTDSKYGGGQHSCTIGESLYFIAQIGHESQLCRLDGDNHLDYLCNMSNIASFVTNGEKTIVTGFEPNRCADLYLLDGDDCQNITNINADYFSKYIVSPAQSISFINKDGIEIEGWALVPEGDGPHPAVLEIHGGPRCDYSTCFYHELQLLCAKGYYVFFCNPRGSEGYGETFADLRGKYGTIDYEDLMAFLDHALSVYPDALPDRLGACGGSYGGFMCNWIEGHTDRFAAIASQRSVSNWVSDFGTSEIGIPFDKNEMAADPWTDMELMWTQSPLKYANQAKTPILFIHSLCDYNCTLDQGIQMFNAMKYFGVPTRMCLFENENHSLSRSGKPLHRLRRLNEICNWFATYLDAK